MNKLNKLESIVITKLLSGESRYLEKLRKQLNHLVSVKREYTGAGFFTYLHIDRNENYRLGNQDIAFGDVEAKLKGMSESVGFVIFIKDGWVNMLEGYTYAEKWPKEAKLSRLAYFDNERDMNMIEKELTGQKVSQKPRAINIDWEKAERFDYEN